MNPPPLPDREFRQPLPRMRSGSGTTNTSDSGEVETNGLAVGPRSSHSASVSSSPSQPSAGSLGQYHSSHGSNHSQSSMGAHPSNYSSLSPFASRVRERDADAMEKYMRRNRSESQGTSSTDNKSQNGSFVSSTGDDNFPSYSNIASGAATPRRLRPSISASQLRSTSPVYEIPSGATSASPSSTTPVLTRSTSISITSPISDTETYVGPPSQYARFPEPPVLEEGSSSVASRRMAYHPSTKHPHLDSLSASLNHRRGLSAASIRP